MLGHQSGVVPVLSGTWDFLIESSNPLAWWKLADANTAANLLPHGGGFEDDSVDGWVDNVGLTLAVSTAEAYAGSYSLSTTATATGSVSSYFSEYATYLPELTVGQTATFSTWVYCASSVSVTLEFAAASSSGAYVSTPYYTSATISASTWTQITLPGQLTTTLSAAGVAYLNPTIQFTAAAIGEVCYWDSMSYVVGTGTGTPGTAADSSGNGHTGTATAVTFDAWSPLGSAPTETGASFNGTASTITTTYNPTGLTALSVVFIMDAAGNAQTPYNRILSNDYTKNNNSGIDIAVYGATALQIQASIGTGTTYGELVLTNRTFPLTGTHVIVVTWDGTTIRCYIDGVLDSAIGSVSGTLAAGADDLAIGFNPNSASSWYEGELAQVALFGTALNQSEVSALVNAVSTLQFSPIANQAMTVGTAFLLVMTTTGGTAPYTYSATGLPAGLVISGSEITGTPTASGSFSVDVTVHDSSLTELVASQIFAVTIPGASVLPLVPSSLVVPTTLIFDDEFNTGVLNTTIWTPYWYTSEQNNTVMEQSNVAMGAGGVELTLAANNTGGIITTNPVDGVAGHVGYWVPSPGDGNGPVYIEWSVDSVAVDGAIANWPSVWMEGVDDTWPTEGEIDIWEGLSGQAGWHTHWGATHGVDETAGGGFEPLGDYVGQHIYGALWTTTEVVWVYDGVVVGSRVFTAGAETTAMAFQKMLTAENSIAITPPGTYSSTPATITVRYCRVWQDVPGAGAPGAPTLNVPVVTGTSVALAWSAPGGVVITPLQMAAIPAQTATVGTLFTLQLSASGGTTPYVYDALSLPSWLAVSASGLISGTPTTATSYSLGAIILDSSTPQQQAGPTDFTLTVSAGSSSTNPSGEAPPGPNAYPGYTLILSDDFIGDGMSPAWYGNNEPTTEYTGGFYTSNDNFGPFYATQGSVSGSICQMIESVITGPEGTKNYGTGYQWNPVWQGTNQTLTNYSPDGVFGGIVQTRARCSNGAGITMCLGTLGLYNWGPEIDFYEDGGIDPRDGTASHDHYGPNGQPQTSVGYSGTIDCTQWHTWGIEWNPTTVELTVDGTVWNTMSNPNWTTNVNGSGNAMFAFFQCEDNDGGSIQSGGVTVTMQQDWTVIYQLNGYGTEAPAARAELPVGEPVDDGIAAVAEMEPSQLSALLKEEPRHERIWRQGRNQRIYAVVRCSKCDQPFGHACKEDDRPHVHPHQERIDAYNEATNSVEHLNKYDHALMRFLPQRDLNRPVESRSAYDEETTR